MTEDEARAEIIRLGEVIRRQAATISHQTTCLDGYASTHERIMTACGALVGRDLDVIRRVEKVCSELVRLRKESAP